MKDFHVSGQFKLNNHVIEDQELMTMWQQSPVTKQLYKQQEQTEFMKPRWQLAPDSNGQYQKPILYGIKICLLLGTYDVGYIPPDIEKYDSGPQKLNADAFDFIGFESFPGGGIGIKCYNKYNQIYTFKVIPFYGCLQGTSDDQAANNPCYRKRCLETMNCPNEQYQVLTCTSPILGCY